MSVTDGSEKPSLDNVYRALDDVKRHEIEDKHIAGTNVLRNLLSAIPKARKYLCDSLATAMTSAMENLDREALEKAIRDTEDFDQTALPEYQKAKAESLILPQKLCIKLLMDAYKSRESDKLEYALKNVYVNEELRGLGLENSPECRQAFAAYRIANKIPDNFENKFVLDKIVSGKMKIDVFRKPRDELQEAFQEYCFLCHCRYNCFCCCCFCCLDCHLFGDGVAFCQNSARSSMSSRLYQGFWTVT